jgi:hypothetical protein
MIFDIIFDRFDIAPSLFSYYHWIIHFITKDQKKKRKGREEAI